MLATSRRQTGVEDSELVEKMDDSEKAQQYVKLLNKNMADMKSKKEVIVRYVSDLSKVLVLPEKDLAVGLVSRSILIAYSVCCAKLIGCREKWPKARRERLYESEFDDSYLQYDGKKF